MVSFGRICTPRTTQADPPRRRRGRARSTRLSSATAARPARCSRSCHDIQDAIGWIPPESHGRLADALSLSKADVYGVVTFYHDFRSSPPGRHVLKLCRAEACQAMGAEALATRLKAKLGVEFGLTSADGAVTLQPVYCLGNCACSPALMIDGSLVGRVTLERLDRIVADARATR